MFKHRLGFSLIEVLVAATIIAVLAAIGATSYSSVNKRSRDTRRKSDLEQIRSSLEQYRTDKGYYPSQGAGTWVQASTLSDLTSGGYISAIPSDPKSTTQSYWYQVTNPSGTPTLYYGYCLTAWVEQGSNNDSCPGIIYNTGIPANEYVYEVRHP